MKATFCPQAAVKKNTTTLSQRSRKMVCFIKSPLPGTLRYLTRKNSAQVSASERLATNVGMLREQQEILGLNRLPKLFTNRCLRWPVQNLRGFLKFGVQYKPVPRVFDRQKSRETRSWRRKVGDSVKEF